MVLILTRSKHAANRYGEIERIGVVSSKAFFPSSSSSFFFFFILLCVFEFLNCIPFLSLFFFLFFFIWWVVSFCSLFLFSMLVWWWWKIMLGEREGKAKHRQCVYFWVKRYLLVFRSFMRKKPHQTFQIMSNFSTTAISLFLFFFFFPFFFFFFFFTVDGFCVYLLACLLIFFFFQI